MVSDLCLLGGKTSLVPRGQLSLLPKGKASLLSAQRLSLPCRGSVGLELRSRMKGGSFVPTITNSGVYHAKCLNQQVANSFPAALDPGLCGVCYWGSNMALHTLH